MKPVLLLLAAALLAGCASPAREARKIVSIKPEVSRLSKPVAETRKSVTAAAAGVTTARQATAEARALAAKTAEAEALAVQLDKIEFTLATTQADLTAALASVTESEQAVAVLEAQIEQQTAELAQAVMDYNQLAAEKREVEIANAAGRQREAILWKFLIAFIVAALAEAVAIYLLLKKPF